MVSQLPFPAPDGASEGRQHDRARYFPGVDGLRTLAVLAVVAFHSNRVLAPGGFLGVDVFFVISGFVITLTLVREHERSGRIRLGAFYGRRFWRLMPALVATVLVTAGLVLASGAETLRSFGFQATTGLTYTYNIAQVVRDDRGGGILSHLWSLSVEEQFYLVWGPLLAIGLGLLVARRARIAAIGIGIGVFFVVRIVTFLTLGELAGFFLPFARFDQFLVGAGVALLLHHAAPASQRSVAAARALSLIRRPWVPLVALVGIALAVLFTGDLLDEWLFFGGFTLVALLTAVVVGHVCAGGPGVLNRALASAPLVWLGRRSYGIYLYHYPLVVVMRHIEVPWVLHLPLSLGGGILLAAASFRWIEEPLRRLGHRAPVVTSVRWVNRHWIAPAARSLR